MAIPFSLLRRLTLSVLLPLALLIAQQGAMLHEWSHWHAAKAGVEQQLETASAADRDLCLTCLGFAQIAGLAKFDVAILPTSPALRDRFQAQSVRDVADRATPPARSRGPPRFL
jgi:hypothetical protein